MRRRAPRVCTRRFCPKRGTTSTMWRPTWRRQRAFPTQARPLDWGVSSSHTTRGRCACHATISVPRPSGLNASRWIVADGHAGSHRCYWQVLPHNFAILVRKGRGWDAVLSLWTEQLRRMHRSGATPDDQWALALTLRALHRTGGCVNGSRSQCRQPVRVWRLRESFATGFKSANKRALGFFPRSCPRGSTPRRCMQLHCLCIPRRGG